MTDGPIREADDPPSAVLRDLRAHVFRFPTQTPVRTSFGVMHDRPALFVRVEDSEGGVGWGEVWCNFPACGAEHRAKLIETVFAPLLVGRCVADPGEIFEDLAARTAVLSLQSGEPGPLAQCIAGIDIALWDLAARRAGQPLWRHLGGTDPRVRVYASGINPERPQDVVAARHAEGYRDFKLKLGFGEERDLENLGELRRALGPSGGLMADANQAWDLATALRMAGKLDAFDLRWLEEPLRADQPWSQWQALARASRTPLAGGENLAGHEAFANAVLARAWGVVQPDVAKWGGISGCRDVARATLQAGLRYCPHCLGGGIGLLASAHLLAAVGGDGMLEVDANPNPLRSLLCGPLGTIDAGMAKLSEDRGLGVTPDLHALRTWQS